MGDTVTEHLAALLPSLLRSMEVLGFVVRHFHPPDFGAVMDAAGRPDQDLRSAHGSRRRRPKPSDGSRPAAPHSRKNLSRARCSGSRFRASAANAGI